MTLVLRARNIARYQQTLKDSLEHPIAKTELLENRENKLLTLNRLMALLTESIEKMPLQQHRLNIELNEKAAKMQRKQR